MDSKQIREKYIKFFVERGHKEIAPAKLVPENDPTTLFTSSGMQPLIPYLLGQEHPEGKRLVNAQKCFRSQDIEEVGDSRHTTFFEMLGNWSLGDYFKADQLKWVWEFLVQELKLNPNKLYVTVFEGNAQVPADEESEKIWRSLGLSPDHIYKYGVDKNWWSRSGTPEQMPIGEIGGPDSEVFYDFGTTHDPKYAEKCHPNCDCGRFLEIGNSVFIQYQKQPDNTLKELRQKNVDFGGGLERLAAASVNDPDIFKGDLFWPILQTIEKVSGLSYSDEANQTSIRIIADHLKAAVFMADQGVTPSNKQQGYLMRRLIRRATVKMIQLNILPLKFTEDVVSSVFSIYGKAHLNTSFQEVSQILATEVKKFEATVKKGMKIFQTQGVISGQTAFDLYQTYGFPLELTQELAKEKGQEVNLTEFRTEVEQHQQASRTASAGMFKGGLQDQNQTTIKYHTATHLLHAALRQILGEKVRPMGANITSLRLRFDFSHPQKLTEAEISQVEALVNSKIAARLPVTMEIMEKGKAFQSGALGFFGEKYGEKVNVYEIAGFSREICGGPHVKHTGEIGQFKITKQESVSAGVRRIYAVIS